MSRLGRIGGFFGRLAGVRRSALPDAQPAKDLGPRQPVNDAEAYGVTITRAAVAPGGWYWQAVRVHHLTPEENNGNHHIFLEVLDPASSSSSNPEGRRVFGARARIAWEGGESVVTLDKPPHEPNNVPMWRWQVCTVEILGLPGEALPSDQVAGLHTGHPEEGPGNTLFHHSFSITFLKVQAPAVVYADSVLYGVIRRAHGRTAVLNKDGEAISETTVGAADTFRFSDLPGGEYAVTVRGTSLQSDLVRLDGRNQVQLDLTLVVSESVISGRIRNGAGRKVRLIREDVEVADQEVGADERFRFSELVAGEYHVAVEDTGVASALLSLDGMNAAEVELVAPAPGRLLTHYVLFGPADEPSTQANLVLAQDYLLAFEPSFGFSADEAGGAGMVTILADEGTVSSRIEQQLAAAGVPVQRIAGTVEEVAAALAERIAKRQAFL